MSKKKRELTPFEKAKRNIRKTAENFNIYHSVEMLAETILSMENLSKEDQEGMEIMFKALLIQMSEFIDESGSEWN